MDETRVHLVVQAEVGQCGAQQEQRRPERHEAVWRRSAQRAHVHPAGSTRDPGHLARAAPGGSGGGRAAVHDPRSLGADKLRCGLATHGHSPARCPLLSSGPGPLGPHSPRHTARLVQQLLRAGERARRRAGVGGAAACRPTSRESECRGGGWASRSPLSLLPLLSRLGRRVPATNPLPTSRTQNRGPRSLLQPWAPRPPASRLRSPRVVRAGAGQEEEGGGGAGGPTSPPLPRPRPPTCAGPALPQAQPNGFIHSSQGALQIFTECPPGVRCWDRRHRGSERKIQGHVALSELALGGGQSEPCRGKAWGGSAGIYGFLEVATLGPGSSFVPPLAPVTQTPSTLLLACQLCCPAHSSSRDVLCWPFPPRVPLPLGTFLVWQR